MDINLPQATYPDYDEVIRLHEELRVALHDVPGVDAAGATGMVPLGPLEGFTNTVVVEGMETLEEPPRAQVRPSTPGSLESLGVDLVEGRMILEDDRSGGAGVVVVTQAFVSQILQGTPALGQRIRFGVVAVLVPALRTLRINLSVTLRSEA